MKKQFLILLFGLFSLAGISQTTLYGVAQPSDLGVGCRIDQQIGRSGLYASYAYGNYRFNGGYIDDHHKISFGGLVLTPQKAFYTLGLNYHTYGENSITYISPVENSNVLTPFSFDIGVGIRMSRFVSAITVDIIKWDVGLSFGYIILNH